MIVVAGRRPAQPTDSRPFPSRVFHLEEDDVIHAKEDITLVLAKKDVKGVTPGVEQMLRYAASSDDRNRRVSYLPN